MSSMKRHHDDGADAPSKRQRSETPASDAAASVSAADLIARKRAEVAAKIASFSQKTRAGAGLPSLATPPASASLPAKPATRSGTPSTTGTPTPSGSVPPGVDPEIAKKIAEIKRRANITRANVEISSNPYLAAAAAASSKKPGAAATAPVAPQSAGLKVAAHPLLLETTPTAAVQNKKDRYKPMQPKFASIKANARNVSTPTPPPPPPVVKAEPGSLANPYTLGTSATPEPGSSTDKSLTLVGPKDRPSRSFRFNQKGKYIALGQQMRQDQQLEDLKKRIAETAKKAGLDSEFENLEKTIRQEAPPDAEWWDVALLPGKSYDDIAFDENEQPVFTNTNIRTEDSPITFYVQHPIPIPAPGEKDKVALKPLKLTKREQKKIRRQRRMAEMQDKQDRQKMGLIPPDPPKVRLANLMRVLTTDAVQDPTKVEARVRREVAMRKKGHDDMNASRKLTEEQKREKTEIKKTEEEKKGVFGAVFKIKTLSDPSHRFKVRKNAEQFGLTGVCIFNPSFSLVLVEGSSKAIKQYTRLMLVRIQWTEAARERGASAAASDAVDEEEVPVKKEDSLAHGSASLEDNTCDKVWEGPLRDRSFTNFRAKSCPTDSAAKNLLGEKLSAYWDVAKSYVREEDL